MKIDLSKLPKVTNDIYLPLYKNSDRFLVIYGGAGSGKSRFIGQKILYRCLIEKHRFLIVRKVARTLKDSVFKLFVDYIGAWKLGGVANMNKSNYNITFANGSEIMFYGLDDVEKLKSIEGVTSIWIEEASELVQEDLTQLNLRLRGFTKSYQQIILSFNPISSEHWLKKYFFDRVQDNCTILKSTYLDNCFINPEYHTQLSELQYTNKLFYDIYCLGNWGVIKGRVYDSYTLIDDMPKDFEAEFYGVDFGYNDPTVVIYMRLKGKELYINELLFETHLTNGDVIQRLKIEYPWLQRVRGYFEWAEPDRLEEFRRAGFAVNRAKKDILLGINKVKEYKMFVTKKSLNVIKELELYSWKEDKNGNSTDMPMSGFDHTMDSIRYGVFTYTPPQNKYSGSFDI